jgi:hypothetical protein
MGTSAPLSEYVRRHRCHEVIDWHFCQNNSDKTLQPERSVRHLAGQLAHRIRAYSQTIEKDEVAQKRQLESSGPHAVLPGGHIAYARGAAV